MTKRKTYPVETVKVQTYATLRESYRQGAISLEEYHKQLGILRVTWKMIHRSVAVYDKAYIDHTHKTYVLCTMQRDVINNGVRGVVVTVPFSFIATGIEVSDWVQDSLLDLRAFVRDLIAIGESPIVTTPVLSQV